MSWRGLADAAAAAAAATSGPEEDKTGPVTGPTVLVGVVGRGLIDAAEPVVTADDLGLTRGDGCFDATRVLVGADGVARADHLDAHLDRLAASAAALDIEGPPREGWQDLIAELLAAWTHPGEAVLKLVLTRGSEWRGGPPTALATIVYRGDPQVHPHAFSAREGIRIITLSRGHPSDAFVDAPWLLGGVKTLSYVVNAAATREARRRGADDVLFTTTDGYCLDGPTSGLLVVRDGELLSTPLEGTGLLESVTVTHTMEAARASGMSARHELIPVADLGRVEGVWLASSGRGPAPVREIDGSPLHIDPDLVSRIARFAGFCAGGTVVP